jgi:hypothetical protein
MVAFLKTDLPDSVNTVEKLAYWAVAVLNNVDYQSVVQEVPGTNQPTTVFQQFSYLDSGTRKWRFVGRVSTEISPNFQKGDAKPWTYVQALSSNAIPTEFKS